MLSGKPICNNTIGISRVADCRALASVPPVQAMTLGRCATAGSAIFSDSGMPRLPQIGNLSNIPTQQR
jgi:hypothetical protein